jgi:hypothetical protein
MAFLVLAIFVLVGIGFIIYALTSETHGTLAKVEKKSVDAAADRQESQNRYLDAKLSPPVIEATKSSVTIQMKTIQAESQLRRDYVPSAQMQGVDVDGFIAANVLRLQKGIEFDFETRSRIEAVRLAIIAKHLSEHQKLILINEQLDRIYDDEARIETSDDTPEVKRRKIADREVVIDIFKEERNAINQRLIQARGGGDLRGDDADTDGGRSLGGTVENSELTLPPKKPRGRPIGSTTKRGGA